MTEVSFSRIQTYTQCPWKYHLVYNEGWRAGPRAEMAFGASLHKALHLYHLQKNINSSINDIWVCLDESWINEGYLTTEATLEAYEKAKSILAHYHEQDKKRSDRVVESEKEFQLALEGGVTFRCTLDSLNQFPDGTYQIIEYKTHPHGWTEDRIRQDLQMTLYAWAMKKVLHLSSIKLSYHFLSSATIIPTNRTEEQLSQAEKLIYDVADKIRQLRFEPNHKSCIKCEFQNRCVKKGHNETTMAH